MRRIPRFIAAMLICASAPALLAQAQKPPTDHGTFPLTVDSIMRGPDLVGYPPEGLRWSADSQKLYFEWRKPGEEQASTYVVNRDGGALTKLTDEQRKNAPPVNGRWDKAHKRVVFADRGDIAFIDEHGVRHQITRTTGTESSPRWARHDTAITYVRDGNLYLVPAAGVADLADAGGGGDAVVQQLTDIGPKKTDPRLTDSQTFIRGEEEKLLDAVR